jgi:hypothetical protein
VVDEFDTEAFTRRSMTTLDPADGYLVLINTFTVEPSRADELLAVLPARPRRSCGSVPASSRRT